MSFISKKQLSSLGGILFLLILWILLAQISESEQIFPGPLASLKSSWEIISSPQFWPDILHTISRGLLGFLFSIVIAFAMGVPAGMNSLVFRFFNPLLVTIRSTPVISIILLAIIWLGNEKVAIFIAFLTMFPVICLNVIEGVRNVDRDLLEMANLYKVNKRRQLLEVYIPSILPFLISGVSNALGFGWRAIIIGEVLSQPIKGIGTRMQESQSYLLVAELIAWTLIAVLISYLFEMLLRSLEKRWIVWKES